MTYFIQLRYKYAVSEARYCDVEVMRHAESQITYVGKVSMFAQSISALCLHTENESSSKQCISLP